MSGSSKNTQSVPERRRAPGAKLLGLQIFNTFGSGACSFSLRLGEGIVTSKRSAGSCVTFENIR